MNSPKKILYVPSLSLPLMFWRIEHYARNMLNHYHGKKCFVNVEMEGIFSPYNEIAWDRHIFDLGQKSKDAQGKLKAAFKYFDVIIFQAVKHQPGLDYIKELKKEYPETKILVEIDDSVGELTPSNLTYKFKIENYNITADHIQISDGVICSTEYLANSVKHINTNTYVAPNCVDPEIFKVEKTISPYNPDIFRVGYIAGAGHDEDLLIAYKAMLPILERRADVNFIIRYGGYRPDFIKDVDGLSFENWDVHISEYAQKRYDLHLDLNLCPLRDTEFNRCKSNLKMLESLIHEIPVVASNVEPYKKSRFKDVDFIRLTDNDIIDWRSNIEYYIQNKNNHADRSRSKYWTEKHYNIKKEVSNLLDWINVL